MSEFSISPLREETVVIVGVGMIGGSIAAAIKRHQIAKHVIGVGRDPVRTEAARAAGLIDEAATDVASVLGRASLVIFCTPVERVAADVRHAMNAMPIAFPNSDVGPAGSNLLFTDVGSVKSPICSALSDIPSFVGSHPIAGSHRQGFEAADAQLFANRLCVVTPLASSTEPRVERLEKFWHAVGMRTVRMSPENHDSALAMTSHLPHVVAAALASTLLPENRLLSGSGFRDTTRVAGGDPDLWSGILTNNAEHVIHGIDRIQRELSAYRDALASGNSIEVRQLLLEGQRSRSSLDETRHG
jgi:prephenate dehydrogenase